jgi:hypothetical protein
MRKLTLPVVLCCVTITLSFQCFIEYKSNSSPADAYTYSVQTLRQAYKIRLSIVQNLDATHNPEVELCF